MLTLARKCFKWTSSPYTKIYPCHKLVTVKTFDKIVTIFILENVDFLSNIHHNNILINWKIIVCHMREIATILTVNGIRCVFKSPVARFFCEKYRQIICIWIFGYVTKIQMAIIEKFKPLATLGSCHVTTSRQGVNKNLRFFRFLEHISESFQYFFIKSSW